MKGWIIVGALVALWLAVLVLTFKGNSDHFDSCKAQGLIAIQDVSGARHCIRP